jgi:hypothetical protein
MPAGCDLVLVVIWLCVPPVVERLTGVLMQTTYRMFLKNDTGSAGDLRPDRKFICNRLIYNKLQAVIACSPTRKRNEKRPITRTSYRTIPKRLPILELKNGDLRPKMPGRNLTRDAAWLVADPTGASATRPRTQMSRPWTTCRAGDWPLVHVTVAHAAHCARVP